MKNKELIEAAQKNLRERMVGFDYKDYTRKELSYYTRGYGELQDAVVDSGARTMETLVKILTGDPDFEPDNFYHALLMNDFSTVLGTADDFSQLALRPIHIFIANNIIPIYLLNSYRKMFEKKEKED